MKKLLAKKKNNKGFSLVELIVVILIMAIIAVALAPQVMKWVGESRKSTDENNKATIKSAVSAGVADYMSKKNIEDDVDWGIYKDGLYVITVSAGAATKGTKVSDSDATTLGAKVLQVMNGDFPKVQNEDGKIFHINVQKTTGKVTIDTVTGTYE